MFLAENARKLQKAEGDQQEAEKRDQVVLYFTTKVLFIIFTEFWSIIDENGLTRQRMGGDLDDLNIKELQALEDKMDTSLVAIRDRKVI